MIAAIKKKWLVICTALVIGFAGYWYNINEHINYLLLDFTTSEQNKKSAIWLPNYQATEQAQTISCIEDNLSDITYNKKDQLFYLVVNSPSKLVVINEKGACLKEIDLGLEDTEAITWIKDNQFLISEERKFKVSIIEIDHQTPNGYRIIESLSLGFLKDKNLGLEAVAYNRKSQSIILSKEKSPILFYEVSGLTSLDQQKHILINRLLDDNDFNLKDLSGMFFHENTGHAILLSDESRELVEIDKHGSTISHIDLDRGLFNLKRSIPQAEGVTMDDKDNIYIISEPNLFYKFSPKS